MWSWVMEAWLRAKGSWSCGLTIVEDFEVSDRFIEEADVCGKVGWSWVMLALVEMWIMMENNNLNLVPWRTV